TTLRPRADLPSPKCQTGSPASGADHGAGATENTRLARTVPFLGIRRFWSTGPPPVRSDVSTAIRGGELRFQTVSVTSLEIRGFEEPAGETSTGGRQLPEAAGRIADWTAPFGPLVQTATAFPLESRAMSGSAAVELRAETGVSLDHAVRLDNPFCCTCVADT